VKHRTPILALIALSAFSVAGTARVVAVAAPVPRPQTQVGETPAGPIAWTPLPGPGKKVKINGDYSFTYEFSQRPQMGTIILIIRVTDRRSDQVLPFKITGRSDMPSMRGAHDSGDVEFKTNRGNNYLLPVNIVMPGDWEVRVTFSLNDTAVFHGSIRFDV
jgi:hypothetical protein